MIIKFKLDDYYETLDKYEEVFEQADVEDVIIDENCFVTSKIRIVIPQLQVSFREAEWYARNEDIDDLNNEDAYEIQCSVLLQYAENEITPENFISYASCDLSYFADNLCRANGIDPKQVPQLDCYIDTDEFIQEIKNQSSFLEL